MSYEPPILKNSPLQTVVLELRFPEVELLPEDRKALRRNLAKSYPVPTTQQGVSIQLNIQGAIQQRQGAGRRYTYRSREGSHQVAVSSTALVLEARGRTYEGFESLLNRWLDVLDVVAPIVDLDTQLRLGMRYVNQIPVEDASEGLDALVDRIQTALLSPLGTEGFEFSIARSFQELRMTGAQGKATLRHGLQVPPLGEQRAGIYMLDVDFYDDDLMEFDRDRHVDQLKRFNLEVWKVFRWSITDSEYERMQPEERIKGE